MPLHRQCLICRAHFTTCPSLNKKYCGRKCFHMSKHKEFIKTRYRGLHVGREHPLTLNSEVVGEHRVILWEKIGAGSHPCHHCGEPVTWIVGAGTAVRDALVVDHLDRNPLNNDPGNLAPSCQPCNWLNCDRIVRDDEDYRVILTGTRVRGERRSCEQCAGSFVAWPSGKAAGRGRFCSRSCARRAPRKKTVTQGPRTRPPEPSSLRVITPDVDQP
jgi:hypothetical protein